MKIASARLRRILLGLAALAAALLAGAGPTDAQVLYGSIVGRVSDTSQAVVPGAKVIAIHEGTNLARETTTDRDGTYRFGNVPPGAHTVRAVLAGFKEYVKNDVPVSANTLTRVDVTLEVGALTEAITVQSAQALLQADTGDLHAELESEEITSLPLGNYRSYQTLLSLVPGTTTPSFSTWTASVNADAPSSPLSINVNVFRAGWTTYTAPAETIHTVNISTSNFDAEQGMAGGSAITVLTKSGSNELHGSAVVLHENEDLRARHFFNPEEKGDSSLYMGGVTLGGPVITPLEATWVAGASLGPAPQHRGASR